MLAKENRIHNKRSDRQGDASSYIKRLKVRKKPYEKTHGELFQRKEGRSKAVRGASYEGKRREVKKIAATAIDLQKETE